MEQKIIEWIEMKNENQDKSLNLSLGLKQYLKMIDEVDRNDFLFNELKNGQKVIMKEFVFNYFQKT